MSEAGVKIETTVRLPYELRAAVDEIVEREKVSRNALLVSFIAAGVQARTQPPDEIDDDAVPLSGEDPHTGDPVITNPAARAAYEATRG